MQIVIWKQAQGPTKAYCNHSGYAEYELKHLNMQKQGGN